MREGGGGAGGVVARALQGLPPWAVLLLGALVAVQAALTTAHVAVFLLDEGKWLFDLDREANVPTWWTTVLLAATGAAALLACLPALRPARWNPVPHLVVGLGFLGLSLDEFAQIHDEVSDRMRDALGGGGLWVLPYLPLLAAGAWAIVRVAGAMEPPCRRLMLAGLAILMGAVAAEVVSGRAEDTLRHPLQTLLEENGEMLGTGLVLTALAIGLVTSIGRAAAPGPTADGVRR